MTQPMSTYRAADDRWMADALCLQTDPDSHFPDIETATSPALRTCQGCPVTAECLTYALAHDERFGIWGGMTSPQRSKLKREA